MNNLLNEKGVKVRRFVLYKNIENVLIDEFLAEQDGNIIDIQTVATHDTAFVVIVYKAK